MSPAVRAAGPEPPFTHDAVRWLTVERAFLVAAVRRAHEAMLWRATWELAMAIRRFLSMYSYWDDWRHTQELALDAARRAGNEHAEALAMYALGDLAHDQKRWSDALTAIRECLPLLRVHGDRLGEARALLERLSRDS